MPSKVNCGVCYLIQWQVFGDSWHRGVDHLVLAADRFRKLISRPVVCLNCLDRGGQTGRQLGVKCVSAHKRVLIRLFFLIT